MQAKGLDLVLWVVGFVEHIALLGILWFTSRQKVFPIFTSLIFLSVLRTATLFVLLHQAGKMAYFYGYWSFAVIDTFLQLLVIGEAALHVFRPVKTWVPGSQTGLIALLTSASVVAEIVTWLATPYTDHFRQFVVIKGNLFSSLLVSELLVGLVVLATISNLPLNTDAARILKGLGCNALLAMIVQTLQAHVGATSSASIFTQLSRVGVIAYFLCLNYWIFAFRKKAVVARELPDKLREQLFTLNTRLATELRNLQSLGR